MRRFKKNKHPNIKKRPKIKGGVGKKNNTKFIQRAKTTENFHKKQKVLEDKYREEVRPLKNVLENDDPEDSDSSEGESFLPTLNQPLNKHSVAEIKHGISKNIRDENKGYAAKQQQTESKGNEPECHPDSNNKQLFLCSSMDPFANHLDTEFSTEEMEKLLQPNTKNKCLSTNWPSLKSLNIELKEFRDSDDVSPTEKFYMQDRKRRVKLSNNDHLQQLGVKELIAKNTLMPMSQLQSELFVIMNNYHDIYYNEKNVHNSAEIQMVYCLHSLNHVLKTRSRVIHHNAKLKDASNLAANGIISDTYRDQGLTRPKVLFLLPNRNAAYQIVNTLVQLLQGNNTETSKSNATVINYSRFASEYTGNELFFPKTNPKPEDYEKTFAGNTDDNFRIGLSLTKKCIKLYTEFYASDILIASPLGLRTVIGASGSKERDFDFLSSIELLIIDQAELLIAQNWENVMHVLDHMHLPPNALRDTDFQRVRHWYLNGLAKFYRQTFLFSTHDLPEFRALFSKCCNYEGKVRIANTIEFGDIRNVIVSIPQLFQRIDVSNFQDIFDIRFKYFVDEVLPKLRSPSFAHCMIYIPSYFDYVRLRNYFKAESVSCVQICEYTKKEKIARARDMFFHSGAQFLLYSERSHFFRRTRIKGIRHLIMYQLPHFPQFYSEIINLMHENNQNSRDSLQSLMSITVLYTKYDMIQLSAIVGSKMASDLLKSAKSLQYISTE